MAELRQPMHKRTASYESSSSAAGPSSQRLILEHILTYPGTYELPLRTMYALNSAPRALPPRPKTPAGMPTLPQGPGEAAQKLTTSLMAEISQMPNQPTSLPVAFITTFVRKCFASELSLVDFPQALTGLDYLKDLENRRIREMHDVLVRININLENVDHAEDMLRDHPDALEWFRSLEERTQQVEALYTKLYVALRRWILINEMSLEPFNKNSCLAMLNTVYPPMAKAPTTQLTPSVLAAQRDQFFKYILVVEKRGPSCLANLIALGKRSGEENGWLAARQVLDKYLMTANSMIDECQNILSEADVSKRSSRKADSGISFVDRDSRKNSSSSEKSISIPTSAERPVSRATPHKSSSALEKLAREIRHLKRNKADVSEIIPQIQVQDAEQSPEQSQRPSMRKMRSLSSLNIRRSVSRNGSVAGSTKDIPKFDVEEMKKHRLAAEVHMMAAAG
ncbi:hypothetical protein CAC42_6803 [Sphaceloma murrayae]|uniref:Uncharacterized protein n=1 Tax=Sphaceloma murrayae TaxID=2082308 RepID=A0A2K1QHA9_9PEZI|nr:hypothetical protein CAC42_6803 [Sphaceloma murrayae]